MQNAKLDKVSKLYKLYTEGLVVGPAKHEVNPGLPRNSRENYLYFTLPCCLNFQRSSPALWKSALDTYEDADTKYLFIPEEVVEVEAAAVRGDLLKHRLAVQTNKHPAIWLKICQTLVGHYGSDPRNILHESNFDVPTIIRTLQVDKKQLFPYLGGLKLSNYWLFILAQFTDVELKNLHDLSIIPDTHVIRSTVQLGLADATVKPAEVETIWRELLRELELSPVEMHSALWRWSRNGFSPTI